MGKKILIIILSCIFCSDVISQNISDYRTLYNEKKYEESVKIIKNRIDIFYSKRVREKRVPSGYTSIQKVGEKDDLLKLYRNRKLKGFFIEDNPEIAELHFYYGKNLYKFKKYREALSHYTQSLRFRKIKYNRDDEVYYAIAEVFKEFISVENPEFFKAYSDALRQAYTLNNQNYRYSLELGQALYSTEFKNESIFHFSRFVENTKDEVDPQIYIKLASLNESISRYIETEKFYRKYISEKPGDASILFALGYVAYSRTGNYELAVNCFEKVLASVEKKNGDIDIISRCNEYLGDMYLSNLKYSQAEQYYLRSIEIQNQKMDGIRNLEKKLSEKNNEIDSIKSKLIYDKEFKQYEEYEMLLDDKGRLESELLKIKSEFQKLNSGKINWNLAQINVKNEKYERAIDFYRKAINNEYRTNLARSEIVKLQLKIKRGY